MKPTILLVDDNEEMLELLADDLVEKYQVLTAENGQEALNILGKEAIQLIVTDVMMPVMDGFELCKIVKSDLEFCHIPVILLTAKSTLHARITGLELGADAYIEKPFDNEHLLVQIANLLANRNKLKKYFGQLPITNIKGIAYSRTDENFLEKLNETIQVNMEDVELDVDKLARLMNMGRTSLFRKIKSITDLTPNDLINVTRLKKAAELLTAGNYRIYEVSIMVGYASQTNFGRNFLKQFGMTPTEYQKRILYNNEDNA